MIFFHNESYNESCAKKIQFTNPQIHLIIDDTKKIGFRNRIKDAEAEILQLNQTRGLSL